MSAALDLLGAAAGSGLAAITALAWPCLVFFAIGFAVKRGQLVQDLVRAFPQSLVNLQLLVFNVVLIVPLILLLSQLAAEAADRWNLRLVDPAFWQGVHPVLVAAAAIFIGDFIGYWRHRLEHTPILWPSHAVHHSDDEMDWLTLERFHPINRLTTFAIDNGVLVLLGFPPLALGANNLVRHYYGYLIHADLPWTYGRASWLFVSPAMHRWHHAADPLYFQTNFATVFSVFDRLFGTFRVPGPCDAPLGVTDQMQPSLSGQLTYMLKPRAYTALLQGRVSPFSWRPRREKA